MKDRIPTYPGRVLLTPVPGQPNKYDLVRADEPTEEGTPLNKATLLKDSTAALLGLDPTADPTVDDAFVATVLVAKNACLVKVSVTVGGAPAKAGVLIQGLTNVIGGTLYTASNGEAYGLTTTGTTTISVPTYVDMLGTSKTISTPMQTIVSTTLALSAPVAGERTITTTTTGLRFSPYVSGVDVHVINGGSGGGTGSGYATQPGFLSGGVGGNAGMQSYQLDILPDVGLEYTAIVASGGAAQAQPPINGIVNSLPSLPGGLSSFMGVSPPAGGATGGVGAYDSYDGTAISGAQFAGDGVSSSVKKYGSGAVVGGGSGGGGGARYYGAYANGGAKGSPFGGAGGSAANGGYGSAGASATGYGGGGGGGSSSVGDHYASKVAASASGAGYQGVVFFRWRVF